MNQNNVQIHTMSSVVWPQEVKKSLSLHFVLSVWSIPLLPLRLHCRHSPLYQSKNPPLLSLPPFCYCHGSLLRRTTPSVLLLLANLTRMKLDMSSSEWLLFFFCFSTWVDYRFGWRLVPFGKKLPCYTILRFTLIPLTFNMFFLKSF